MALAHQIETPRLQLTLKTPQEVLDWVETLPPDVQREISPVWIERVRQANIGDVWLLGFTITERASGTVVGACGFKGPPDVDGSVELAYGIDDAFRCRGYATECVQCLTQYAFQSVEITTIRAHTLHANAASIRVLEKSSFHLIGDVIDPEDGLVQRWEWKSTDQTNQAHL